MVNLNEEPCFTCHKIKETIGNIPPENLIREFRTQNSERILGLVNPMLNEPDYYNDPCHAHSKKDELLGLIGIKIPLNDLDKGATETRNKMLIFSGVLILSFNHSAWQNYSKANSTSHIQTD